MHIRSQERRGRRVVLAAMLVATLAACQAPAPQPRRAAEASVLPAPADVTPAAPADEPEADAAPDDVAPPAPPPVVAEPAVPPFFDAGGGAHCLEPPERVAAREGMRRAAEDRARAAERLRDLRTELEEGAGRILADLSLADVPVLAARVSARAAEISGWSAASPELLTDVLREAAFYAVLCRALRQGSAECDRLDAAGAGDGERCRASVRMLELARRRPRDLTPTSAVALALGWQGDRAAAEMIWQVARRGLREEACDRIARPGARDHWALPLCRAVAARDVSRCDVFEGGARRRGCAALLRAVIGPDAAADLPPDAVGGMLGEWVAGPVDAVPCGGGTSGVLSALLDAAAVFELEPVVWPEIERDRGLAPAP